jgi:capsular exopolysaccharide synthesis family protein
LSSNENLQLGSQANQFIDEDISLNEMFRPLWANRWKVLFISLLITVLVTLYVSILKPTYRATSILQIGINQPSQTLSINDAFNESIASEEQINTQYELLKSRKFAVRVIEELDLLGHPEFTANKYKEGIVPAGFANQEQTNASLNSVIGQIRGGLTIKPVAMTELVHISFDAYDPELAKNIANQMGHTYLKYQEELHSASKESTSHWLVEQLENLEIKLKSSERNLQEFREREQIVDTKGVLGLISDELADLTAEELRIERRKDSLAITSRYVNANSGDYKRLAAVPEVANHPAFIQDKKYEDDVTHKLSEIAKRYGPKHPKRISVEAELATVKERLESTVKEISSSLQEAYLTEQERGKAIANRVASAKADFLRLTRLKNEFSQLEREVETNKQLYDTYLIRLKEADAMADYKANFYVRFIDKAVVPKSPIKPRKSLIVMLVLFLSVLASSAYFVLRELLMDTLNTRRKLDNFHDAPVLAVLPKIRGKLSQASELDNHFTESIRTLRTSLLFREGKKSPKVITVTSSVPNEGKSTVALQLARSFAEMEKVLLIEADLRNPSLTSHLNLDDNRPGLSNLLAKTHEMNECIYRDSDLKLDILTSGISPNNPLAFLSMKRFRMLITAFSGFYDRIIIETPPVNAVSDAVIISKLTDCMLYVVHGGKTKREQITSGLRVLKQVNAPVEGIVINNSETLAATRYGNKYYNAPYNIVKLPVRKQG